MKSKRRLLQRACQFGWDNFARKDFQFFLPEHSFYFNQGYCLTYSLLPTNPDYYFTALTTRFREENDIKARKSIVTFLWFSNTCDGNEFLNAITIDKTLGKEVVDYTTDLLARKLEREQYYKSLDSMSFDELVKIQMASTNRMSDEAIYELDYVTKLLRRKSCRK